MFFVWRCFKLHSKISWWHARCSTWVFGSPPDSPQLLRQPSRVCCGWPLRQLSQIKAREGVGLANSITVWECTFIRSFVASQPSHLYVLFGQFWVSSSEFFESVPPGRYVEIAVCMFDMTKFQRTSSAQPLTDHRGLRRYDFHANHSLAMDKVQTGMYSRCKFRFLKDMCKDLYNKYQFPCQWPISSLTKGHFSYGLPPFPWVPPLSFHPVVNTVILNFWNIKNIDIYNIIFLRISKIINIIKYIIYLIICNTYEINKIIIIIFLTIINNNIIKIYIYYYSY